MVTPPKRGRQCFVQVFDSVLKMIHDDLQVHADIGEREIQILNLLAAGLSNQEIADRTQLTLYTIKWYLKQIYSKLHVSSRTQAVARARGLGILSDDHVAVTVEFPILPQFFNSFLGRDTELQNLEGLLSDPGTRLITLHGLGGVGKTRLALEAAKRFGHLFSGGVIFVSMERMQFDPLDEIARELQISIGSGTASLESLATLLYHRHCLIILDNFEHVTAHAPQIAQLIQRTRRTCILVTTREVLRLQGEVVLPVHGLLFGSDCSPGETNSAYQLYLQRARAVYPAYEPDSVESNAIQRICSLVDGMPLALELAAGWAAVLPAAEIAQRLQADIGVLVSTEQDRPSRHTSIHATFDYSWHMMQPQLQRVIAALAIFHAEGFTLEAAEAVAGASADILRRFLDQSLVQRGSTHQFTFHPLIRQYLGERLHEDPDFLQQVQFRHADYYRRLVAQLNESLHQAKPLSFLDSLFRERFNLRMAWIYAVDHGLYDWLEESVEIGYLCDLAQLWRTTDDLFAFTYDRLPPGHKVLRGRLLAFRALFAFRAYDLRSLERFARESWHILEDTSHAIDGGMALGFLAVALAVNGDIEGSFELIETFEPLLQGVADPRSYYGASAMACARPTVLLFSHRQQEALPLLQKLRAPDWYDVQIHLAECYIDLEMIDKAHQMLVRFYHSALTHLNYQGASAAAFYLAVIDHGLDQQPDAVVHALIDVATISNRITAIVDSSNIMALLLLRRGYVRYARLLFRATLHLLYRMHQDSSMYTAALQIAEALAPTDQAMAALLLKAVTDDPACPPNAHAAALEFLQQFPAVSVEPLTLLQAADQLIR